MSRKPGAGETGPQDDLNTGDAITPVSSPFSLVRKVFADKAYLNERIVERLKQETNVVLFQRPHYRVTMRLNALLLLEAMQQQERSKFRVVLTSKNRVFVNAEGSERIYMVDLSRNTCSCQGWRKHHGCTHIRAAREKFFR